MKLSTRRELVLALGTIVLSIGVVLICVATNGHWTLENVAARLAQTICGSLMIVVGTYLVSWGVSDEAGKAASNFLRCIWDRFLKALGR